MGVLGWKKSNTDNQDNLIEQEIMEIVRLEIASALGELKDDRKYISSNDVDKSKDNFLQIVEMKARAMTVM